MRTFRVTLESISPDNNKRFTKVVIADGCRIHSAGALIFFNGDPNLIEITFIVAVYAPGRWAWYGEVRHGEGD